MLGRGANSIGKVRRARSFFSAHVVLQASLGVATLVMIGDDWTGTRTILLALAHQAVGFAVLALATLQARRLGEALA